MGFRRRRVQLNQFFYEEHLIKEKILDKMNYVRTGGGYKCKNCDLTSRNNRSQSDPKNKQLNEKLNELVNENKKLKNTLKQLEEKIKESSKDKIDEEDILKKIEELSKLL